MKSIKEKRLEFLKSVGEFIKLGVQVVGDEEMGKAVIVCTRVTDYDLSNNEIFELDANKSYPRDAHCDGCLEQVVMSNHAFELYDKGGRKQQVVCGKCFFEAVGLLKESENAMGL